MARTRLGPGGGALPIRSDEKMGPEHPRVTYLDVVVPWRAWSDMLKRSARKKRRQHDKDACRNYD